MKIKKFADAKPYEAPNHHDICGLRLQGFEDGGPQQSWVGLSHILPGGGAGPDSSPLEKTYVVVAGEVTLYCAGEEVVLGVFDSCYIGPNEMREIRNQRNTIASMLVIMPYPKT